PSCSGRSRRRSSTWRRTTSGASTRRASRSRRSPSAWRARGRAGRRAPRGRSPSWSASWPRSARARRATRSGCCAARTASSRRGRRVLEVVLRDGDGLLLLVWFHQIPYFSRRLREGQRLVVHGRVEPPLGGGPKRIIHPEMEILGADEDPATLPRIVPVYEKPTAMHPGAMRRIAQAAVEEFAERVPSALPPAVAARQRVIDLARA